MYNGFNHSVMGASHEVRGLVCQDSSAYKVSENYAVVVVADGHGSKKHFRSHLGSKFAVEATIETIDNFYGDWESIEARMSENHKLIIKNIEKQIILRWNEKVEEHLRENPVTPDEKSEFSKSEFKEIAPESYYGSTLVAAVTTPCYTFGIQLGDGSLVAIFDDLEAVLPMEYEESAPTNITASVCNSNAASMFNSFYVENKKLVALFGSTDGLYTSFGSEYDFLDYHTIITSQLPNIESFRNSVISNLTKRSHYGTEDDISLSCVYDEAYVNNIADKLGEKVAKNKERAAQRKAEMRKNNLQ